jgi:hypothetical protein
MYVSTTVGSVARQQGQHASGRAPRPTLSTLSSIILCTLPSSTFHLPPSIFHAPPLQYYHHHPQVSPRSPRHRPPTRPIDTSYHTNHSLGQRRPYLPSMNPTTTTFPISAMNQPTAAPSPPSHPTYGNVCKYMLQVTLYLPSYLPAYLFYPTIGATA